MTDDLIARAKAAVDGYYADDIADNQYLEFACALIAVTAERDALRADMEAAVRRALGKAKSLSEKSINNGGLAKSMAFFVSDKDHKTYKNACLEYACVIQSLIDDPAAIARIVEGRG